MTELELAEITTAQLEVVAAFMGNYATHVGIYLSLAFGYCVAAYTSGDKLTRFQVVLASMMFVAAAELQAALMYLWVTGSRNLLSEVAKLVPEYGVQASFGAGQIFGLAIWQIGILASLAFMWSIRHPRTE